MDGASAAGGLGALAVLCRYAGANEEGVQLALGQGRTVVFHGDNYEFQVRYDAPGTGQAQDGSSPSAGTSSGSPLTSSSGGRETASSRAGRAAHGVWFGNSRGSSSSFRSGSWALTDDAASGGPGSSLGAGPSGVVDG